MPSLSPELREALCRESDDMWRLLTKQLTYYAGGLLRARRWRCLSTGVAPDGHSADSIAAEAIAQLFVGTNWQPKGRPYAPDELRFELMRLIQNIIRNLVRRKENSEVSNELDLSHSDEELADETYFSNFAGQSPRADEEAQRNEAKSRVRKFQQEFRAFLGSNQCLQKIFDGICAGILKRDDLAVLLEVTPQDVTNARKRLDRKLAEFAKTRPNYPEVFIQEVTNA